jgi:hypothetical protein
MDSGGIELYPKTFVLPKIVKMKKLVRLRKLRKKNWAKTDALRNISRYT